MSTNQRSSSSLSNLSDVSQESSDGLKRQRYGSTSFTDESYVSSHSVNNSVIGDYRIVGAGKDSRAVQLPTNKVVNYQRKINIEESTLTSCETWLCHRNVK
ncbi:hypothetical protein KIN20_009027 [Parelaphostrongylus tenuis]|uniref:Uncharacterized protein n=1 Tax=Parelaphostrongylus tenuis TaxID=148309 RepID=A0AAD5QJB4_PARTN|nr:hypothetical protein KIN20_009027 [Parelaphostrongylus tenuis]